MLRTVSALAAGGRVSDGLAWWCFWRERGCSAGPLLQVFPAGGTGITFDTGRGTLGRPKDKCVSPNFAATRWEKRLALPNSLVIAAALEGVHGPSSSCVPAALEGLLQDRKAGDRVSVPKRGASEQMWCWGPMWNEGGILKTIPCWIPASSKSQWVLESKTLGCSESPGLNGNNQ